MFDDVSINRTRYLSSLSLLLFLLVAVLLFLSHIGSFWSLSADVAHHYALVARIADLGGVPIALDPSLGEMNHYPRYAHALAGAATYILQSPFMAMHVLALVSFIVLWGGVAVLAGWLEPKASFGVKALVFAAGLGAVKLFRLDVYGNELIGNYFFAQFVAQSIVIGALVAWSRCRQMECEKYVEYSLVGMMALLLVGFHLMPALVLACALISVIAFDALTSTSVKSRLGWGAFFAVGLGVSFYIHPSFRKMRLISENDGVLNFSHFSSPEAITVFAVVLCGLFGYLLYRKLINKLRGSASCDRDTVLIAFFFATALLAIIQYVALKFGMGSSYAVKKYGFGLFTGAFVLICIVAFKVFCRRFEGRFVWTGEGFDQAGRVLFPAILLGMAGWAVLPTGSAVSASEIAMLDRSLREFYSTEGPESQDTYDVVFGASKMGPVVDYALSIGALHMPRDKQSLDLLRGERPADLTKLRYFVTSTKLLPATVSSCVKTKIEGRLAVVDAACMLARENECLLSNDLSLSGMVAPSSLHGFSQGEGSGRWAMGHQASFQCTLPADWIGRVQELRVAVISGFSADGRGQRGYLSLNGGAEMEIVVGSIEKNFVLTDFARDGAAVSVGLRMPNSISPKAAGLSTDDRKLGFMIRNVEIVLKK